MEIADTGGVRLAYERGGSGRPLLAIMGMSGTSSHWGEAFLGPLRGEFEVIVYDHRGVGESSRVEGGFTIADLAQDAANLLAALEIDSADVLGISMGGMVAQELALAHPERIRTLTLGCTYCGGEGSALTSQGVMERLSAGMLSGDRERAIRAAWEVNVSPEVAADEELYGEFLALGMRGAVALEVIMAQMRAIAGHDTSARLHELQMPTLVVHGTADEMLPVQNAHVIAERVPGARLEIMEEVGHLFFWERPERSAELVREHAAVLA
jgi:pimeloyl-ACP methyl ester carboxylesterase